METKVYEHLNADEEDEFKSYYVVWKLFFEFIFTRMGSKFKSYYVVWKLEKNVIVDFKAVQV